MRVLELDQDAKGHFLWKDLKSELWTLGCRGLLIEGGAGLYESALTAHAVDLIHWFIGAEGPENGLKWNVPSQLQQIQASQRGIELGRDRLIEWSLSGWSLC